MLWKLMEIKLNKTSLKNVMFSEFLLLKMNIKTIYKTWQILLWIDENAKANQTAVINSYIHWPGTILEL